MLALLVQKSDLSPRPVWGLRKEKTMMKRKMGRRRGRGEGRRRRKEGGGRQGSGSGRQLLPWQQCANGNPRPRETETGRFVGLTVQPVEATWQALSSRNSI